MQKPSRERYQRIAIAGAALATLIVGIAAQQDANPSQDPPNPVQTMSVLPSWLGIDPPQDEQPLFATPQTNATVYLASYGSGNLIDHGGNVMGKPNFYAIYWNSSVASSTATSLGSGRHADYRQQP